MRGVFPHILQAFLIILVAAAAAAGVNAVSPRGISWVARWNDINALVRDSNLQPLGVWEAWDASESGRYIVLDARSVDEFETGHIAGALCVPANDAVAAVKAIQGQLNPKQPVLIYCSGEKCDQSLILGRYLRSIGYSDVSVFVGGIEEWRQTELPIETGL